MYNRSFSTHAVVWRHSGGNVTEKRCKKYFLLMWIRSVWPMVMKPSRRKARKIVAFQKASPKKWADCGLGNCGNPLHSGNTDASINFREAVLKEREGNRVDKIKILLEKNKLIFHPRLWLTSLLYWGTTVLCSVQGRAGIVLSVYQRRF